MTGNVLLYPLSGCQPATIVHNYNPVTVWGSAREILIELWRNSYIISDANAPIKFKLQPGNTKWRDC